MTAAKRGSPAVESLSERELAEIVELVETQALASIIENVAPELVARYDIRVERIGSAVALAARRVDVPMFNRVVGLGLWEPVADAVLDAVDAVYRGANVRYMVQVSPAALSPELHARLEARGLPRMDSWINVIRGVEPPPEIPTDLRIERIGPEQAEALGEIMCTAFELPREYGGFFEGDVGKPGWLHYLGFDGDLPVAAGVLFVHEQAGYLAGGGTLPSHRRRGGQGAIMARRIRDAAELGCRYLVTETFEDSPEHPNPSLHNMLRNGFRIAYPRPNYISFPKEG